MVKVYPNKILDIVDTSYNMQRVHVNRVKPLFDTMLWRDEPCPIHADETPKTSNSIDQQTKISDKEIDDTKLCEPENSNTDWENEECGDEI